MARIPLHGQALDRAVPTEVEMRNTKWLLAAGLIAATTAACTTDSGYYPSTSYHSGYYPSTASSAYYPSSSRGYYSNNPAYNNSYYTANRIPRRGPYGDYDRDGVPNRYDRDANGDGVPDRYQR
jgi:hypothetical protein